MRPLTKEAEQKLIAAIERAAGYVNNGLSPNDAIVKSASESNVPAGHINLMVHAYNTGRTTKQREQSDGTLEKAADFPLASADTVMEALYPKAVKTSAEIQQAHVVSAEYAIPVRDMLARRTASQTKAAAAKISIPTGNWTPPPRDPEAAARRAASEKRAAELAAEELRRQATIAYSKAAAAMEQLHEYFRHPGNMSFQDAVRETELRYGAEATSVFNKLAAVYPFLTKQAATKETVFGECEPCKLAASVLDALEAYNEAQARVPVKQAAAKKEGVQVLTGSILHNPAEEPLTLKAAGDFESIYLSGNREQKVAPDDTYFPTAKETRDGHIAGYRPVGMAKVPEKKPSEKKPGFLGRTLFGTEEKRPGIVSQIAGRLAEAPSKEPVQEAYQSLTDPEHETQLRNIRAQGVLHDLILNDPVISGHDPHEVATAFNDLADVAPQFVDSPAAMQALLRKRLEAGQMADFDINQILGMEKTKADTNKARLETMKIERDMLL